MGSEASPLHTGSLSILVADDDAVSRMVVSGFLRRDGHRVDTAIDGVEAVEAAARERYDLILMDLQMPELDGIEATRRIRASETTRRRIVGLTATLDDDVRRRCVDAGFDDVVEKPVSAALIASVLSAIGTSEEKSTREPEELSSDYFDRFRRDAGSHSARPFTSIVEAILAEMRSQIERLSEEANRADADGAARAAHALRGASATIGAERLAAAMAHLEATAASLSAADLEAEAAKARDSLEAVARLVNERMNPENK
jgi:CheY-like chemotaxis protein/HPt (histidine-containing phosphotransfer) domain-containing protein